MRISLLAGLLGALGLLGGCATSYPTTTAEQGGASSSLYFPGAPADAQVSIDGVPAGMAASFDGTKAVLVVEPGRHQVVLRSPSGTLQDKPVYVGAGDRIAVRVRP
jgi:hypothetical protein